MPNRPTEADLARWEALGRYGGTDELAIESRIAVPALVAEVRRLQRLAAWVRHLADFERTVEIPDDDALAQAIHTDRRILLREMRAILEHAETAVDGLIPGAVSSS